MIRRSRVTAPLAVATIVSTLAVIGALRGPSTVGAEDDRARQPASGPRLVLVDQDIAFAADGEIRLTFRLAGNLSSVPDLAPPTTTTTTTTTTVVGVPPPDPVEAPPPVELNALVVNYAPLATGDDTRRYVGRNIRASGFGRPIDGVVIPNIRDRLRFTDDGTIMLDLAVGTDSGESIEPLVKFDEPGLYPIVVSLLVGTIDDGQVVATYGTIVQRLPGPADAQLPSPPIDLTIAVALDEIGPEPTDAELRAARRELEAVLATTTAITSSATLAIPPLVLADAAERDPVALANALQDDRLTSLPAAPLDVSSATAAGVVDAFARQLREGEDLLTASVPTNVARRDVWIATAPLSAAGAQVVRDLGYRYVVMTADLFESTVDTDLPDTDLFVEIALPDGGSLPLLVVDELGASFTPEATDEALADATAVEWAVRTIADLILDQERGGRFLDRSRVLATPDLSAPDPRLLVALESLVRTTPNIRFSEADGLRGATDVAREDGEEVTVQLPERAGPDLAERLERMDSTAVAMLSVGSMLPDGDPRPAAWASRIAGLVSTGYSEERVAAELDELLATAARLKASVIPPEPFTFTLTGRSGEIDLRLSNVADEPLTVLVRLSSPKLSFPDGERLVQLRPNEQTMIAVPVRARTNGASAVVVEVLTPAGELIDEPVVLGSRVNALTGFGQVLTGGLILVLLTWWFSHWRARRREAAAIAAGDVVARQPADGK